MLYSTTWRIFLGLSLLCGNLAATTPKLTVSGRISSTRYGITLPGYTNAGMPAAGDAGTLRRQTDDAAHAPRGLYQDTSYGNMHVGGNAVNVYEYCPSAAEFTAKTCLDNAVTTLGTTNKHSIIIPDPQVIPANLDLTSYTNLTLVFQGSGRLDPDAAVTVTLSTLPDAPWDKQIFGGSGTVTYAAGSALDVAPVHWWGAVIDETAPLTDSKTAIQAAEAALNNAGNGGIVKFLAGQYNISGKVTFHSNITFDGAGRVETAIQNTHASDPAFQSYDVTQVTRRVNFRNLRILGCLALASPCVSGAAGAVGIDYTNTAQSVVENCDISYNSSHGIWIRDRSFNNILHSIIALNGGDGVKTQIYTAGSTNSNAIIGSNFNGNTGYGINIDNGVSNKIIASTFDGTAGDRIRINHDYTIIEGNHIESTLFTGITITSDSDYTYIAGNYYDPQLATAISDSGRFTHGTDAYGRRLGTSGDTAETLTYGTTVATNAGLGTLFRLNVTDGVAFTLSNPTNPQTDATIVYEIRNSSGGAMGTISWGGAFILRSEFAGPANGERATIAFQYDGTNWRERYRDIGDDLRIGYGASLFGYLTGPANRQLRIRSQDNDTINDGIVLMTKAADGTTDTQRLKISGFAANATLSLDEISDINHQATVSGSAVTVMHYNDSNTASSDLRMDLRVGGTSAGDPYLTFTIPSGQSYYIGVDNSNSDKLLFGKGTAVGTTPSFGTDTTLHLITFGSVPTPSACGTSPSISGNDNAGKITVGTGTVTSCTVTFATAYNTNAPACVVSGDNTAVAYMATTTGSVLTITSSADMNSDVLSYICLAHE